VSSRVPLSARVRRGARRGAGLTLIELLVAMAAVVLIGTMMIAIMSTALGMWGSAERQRKVYARARTVFGYLEDDLGAALTRDPPGGTVRNRLFCEPDRTGRQVLMLTRTFGAGGERGLAFSAGDGLDAVNLPAKGDKPRPDDEDSDERSGRADEELYNFEDDDKDGRVDEDLAPLAGSAQVVYLHRGRELRRAVRSPTGSDFRSMFGRAQVLAGDVLHFGLLFATPRTSSEFGGRDSRNRDLGPLTVNWDPNLPKVPTTKNARGPFGPDRLWDSTRGVLPEFSFYLGPQSKDDGEDDVFPEVVRVVLVLEPHQLRTVRTDTLGYISDTTGIIEVASTQGFPPPGRDDSYILVDDEWVHYKGMDKRSFIVDRRGARGTPATSHPRGASVRCGRTFTRTFYLPAYRSEEATGGPGR
jgi:hypothetical protein